VSLRDNPQLRQQRRRRRSTSSSGRASVGTASIRTTSTAPTASGCTNRPPARGPTRSTVGLERGKQKVRTGAAFVGSFIPPIAGPSIAASIFLSGADTYAAGASWGQLGKQVGIEAGITLATFGLVKGVGLLGASFRAGASTESRAAVVLAEARAEIEESLIGARQRIPAGAPFSGGLTAVQDHFDPILIKLFQEKGVSEFQGLWLDRTCNGAMFDPDRMAIYFGLEANITGRVVGEEVQHAIDFAHGGSLSDILDAAEEQGINTSDADALGDWWHRRVFVREIQNIQADQFGLGILKPYINDVFEAYKGVGGKLTMEQITATRFNGLY
jgi:hypothetical protein